LNIAELSDISSESSVIGTLLLHPDYIAHSKFLKPNYFYNTENGIMYWAIDELYKEGITNIDAYNLSNKLSSNKSVENKLQDANFPDVQETINLYSTAARDTIEEYLMFAKNVVDYAFRRKLDTSLLSMRDDCYNKSIDLDSLNTKVFDKLTNITKTFVVNQDADTLGDNITDIWDEIVSRRNPDGTCGIPSKFSILNKFFTYETGELAILEARMKQGKSVFMMNEAVHKLQNGVPTLVVDTEMQTRLYVERLIAHLTQIDISRVKSGKYSKEEENRIKSCIMWIKSQPFQHIYNPNITDSELYSLCQMYIYKFGLQFLVFDYIKSNEADTGRNYNLLGAKTDFLKNNIAGNLDLSVLTACQLSREMRAADSDKIDRALSVAIKWGFKPLDKRIAYGETCGNMYAQIMLNRLGDFQDKDDEDDYLDFYFDGSKMTITEAEQHKKDDSF
jgi:replicative DNA helicase